MATQFQNPYYGSQPMNNQYGQSIPSQQPSQGMGMQNQNQFGAGGNYRQSYLPGRIVTKEQDIFPNEIPMDGSLAIFLQQDLQMVYAKTWGADGLIHTNAYQLVNPSTQPAEDPIQMILQRLDGIEQTLKKQGSYRKPKYQERRKQTNSEVKENENV